MTQGSNYVHEWYNPASSVHCQIHMFLYTVHAPKHSTHSLHTSSTHSIPCSHSCKVTPPHALTPGLVKLHSHDTSVLKINLEVPFFGGDFTFHISYIYIYNFKRSDFTNKCKTFQLRFLPFWRELNLPSPMWRKGRWTLREEPSEWWSSVRFTVIFTENPWGAIEPWVTWGPTALRPTVRLLHCGLDEQNRIHHCCQHPNPAHNVWATHTKKREKAISCFTLSSPRV